MCLSKEISHPALKHMMEPVRKKRGSLMPSLSPILLLLLFILHGHIIAAAASSKKLSSLRLERSSKKPAARSLRGVKVKTNFSHSGAAEAEVPSSASPSSPPIWSAALCPPAFSDGRDLFTVAPPASGTESEYSGYSYAAVELMVRGEQEKKMKAAIDKEGQTEKPFSFDLNLPPPLF